VQRAYLIASHYKPSRSKPKQKPKFYPTAAGANKSPFCHICYKHDGSLVTANHEHLLGSCKHKDLANLYIKRHNVALAKIQHTVHQRSPLGAFYTIMDASSKQSLPPGVSDTRLPKWVLPQIDTDTLNKLRPDLVIFENLTTDEAKFFDITNETALDDKLRSIKPQVIVHVIELTYTSNYSKALESKKKQHTKLAEYLIQAGWTLSTATPNPELPITTPTASPATQPATHNTRANSPQNTPPPSQPAAAPHPTPDQPSNAPLPDEQQQTTKRKANSIQLPSRKSPRLQAQTSLRLSTSSPSDHNASTNPITGSKRKHAPDTSQSQRMRIDDTRSLSSNTINSNILTQKKINQHSLNRLSKRNRSPSPGQPSNAQPGPSNTEHSRKRHKPKPVPSSSTHSKRPRSPSLNGSQPGPSSQTPKTHHNYSPYIHIVLLGTEGTLFDPIDTLLTTTLEIPDKTASTLLKNLHVHAITFSTLIKNRSKQLDQSLPDIALPPSHSPRPP
jgi:hypothetical protein